MDLTDNQYAAILFLEELDSNQGNPVPLTSMLKKINRSISSTQKIAEDLKRARLIRPIKGPGGGYVLRYDLDEITINAVVDALRDRRVKRPVSGKIRAVKRIRRNLSNAVAHVSIADLLSA